MMMRNLFNEESFSQRIEALFSRHVPLLLRVGGAVGHYANRDCPAYPTLTAEQEARIVELAQQGQLSRAQIAREVGVSPQATARVVKKAGIKLRDGRQDNHWHPRKNQQAT